MDCTEFIFRFSEYYDRPVEQQGAGPMEAHLETCASCRRYHRVVTEGGQLLRSLPRPGVPSDFRPRLQHRIYHIDDEAVISRSSASGTTGATALGMAVLLTLAAWSPTMKDGPAETTASAEPVEVLEPRQTEPPTAPTFFPLPASVLNTQADLRNLQDLWGRQHSHSLLYEYSLLSSARSRDRTPLRQTGL